MSDKKHNLSLGEVLQKALRHQQQGELAQAEELYRLVLKSEPGQPDALHLLGLLYSDQKRYSLAEEHIQQAIRANPGAPEFHNSLGVAYEEDGKLDDALDCYLHAIKLRSDYPEAQNNLGNVFLAKGRKDEAIGAYQEAVRLRPNYVKAWNGLATAFKQQNDLSKAEDGCRRALALAPEFIPALKNLGEILVQQGRLADSENCFRRVVSLLPHDHTALVNVTDLLYRQGRLDEAVSWLESTFDQGEPGADILFLAGKLYQAQKKLEKAVPCYQRLAELLPENFEVQLSLGVALKEFSMGFTEGEKKNSLVAKSLKVFKKAVQLQANPEEISAEMANNLGMAYLELGEHEAAESFLRKAVMLDPGLAVAYYNLAYLLQKTKRIEESVQFYQQALFCNPNLAAANQGLIDLFENSSLDIASTIGCIRRSLELMPDAAHLQSVLAYTTDFDPSADAALQQAERRSWYERYVKPKHPGRFPHSIPADSQRKIRIGYIPGRFFRNASAYAFVPMLLHYDKARFEVYCYSNFHVEDDLSHRIQSNVEGWCDVSGMSDEEAARRIRDDGVDILVDLFGHAGANRLPIYAYKPAPIQVSAWGHANGTGMPEMDYLFSDPVSIPDDERALYVEKVVDLPCQLSYWCPDDAPSVALSPAALNGHVTFGCFNRMVKISDEVLVLWAKLLACVPASRLILKDKGWNDAEKIQHVRQVFQAQGVDANRVEFLGRSMWYDHLKAYEKVDIALDPFPMGGGVTTLDAMWMGVPVVCMKGNTLGKRITSAILDAAGLEEWVAESSDAYLAIACAKAGNVRELAILRKTLRGRIFASPLGNPDIYVRLVELRYREMWQKWCHVQGDELDFVRLPALLDGMRHQHVDTRLEAVGDSVLFSAVELWRRFERNPVDDEVLKTLGKLAISCGKNRLANDLLLLRAGEGNERGMCEELCRYAADALGQGNAQGAIDLLIQALDGNPNDPAALALLDRVSLGASAPVILPSILRRRPRNFGTENPLVSVTVCSYNHEQFIRECVESVLAQGYSPLEIIIADDGSVDRTADIIESCLADYAGPHEVTFVRNRKNLGLLGRINWVDSFRRTSGRFVIQFCGDDVMHPQMVEKMVEVWRFKKVSVVTVNSEQIDMDSQSLGSYYRDPEKMPDCSLESLLLNGVNDCVFGAGMGLDREVYELFPFSHNTPPCHLGTVDIALAFYGGLLDGCEMIYEPLMKYRVHGEQGSLSIALARAEGELNQLIVEERIWQGHLAHTIYMGEVMDALEKLSPSQYGSMKERFKPHMAHQLLLMASRQVEARKKLYYRFGIRGISQPESAPAVAGNYALPSGGVT